MNRSSSGRADDGDASLGWFQQQFRTVPDALRYVRFEAVEQCDAGECSALGYDRIGTVQKQRCGNNTACCHFPQHPRRCDATLGIV